MQALYAMTTATIMITLRWKSCKVLPRVFTDLDLDMADLLSSFQQAGRTLSVLSMALVSRWVPSGLRARPVTVSLCPFSVMLTSSFRRSHTFTTFSMPAVYTCEPGSRPPSRV